MKKLFGLLLILGIASTAHAATNTVSAYGANNQAITISASQINNQQSVGNAIVNTSSFTEVLVSCVLTSSGTGTSATGYVNFYAAGSSDGGTTYGDGVGASSATVTLTSPPNINRIGVCNVVSGNVTYSCTAMPVSYAFNNSMPDHWTLIVENKTGAQTRSMSCNYQGLYIQNQ